MSEKPLQSFGSAAADLKQSKAAVPKHVYLHQSWPKFAQI